MSEDPESRRPPAAPPGAGPDPLTRLRAHVEAAQAAAERMMAEAEAEGGLGGGARPSAAPPPRGWDAPRPPQRADPDGAEVARLMTAVFELLRNVVPRELQRQALELVRELLLGLRALIDSCLERLDARRSASVEIEDIPIE
jgi:hypothetical protein